MPTRTYMGVDVRRDHSYRVPRPGFTADYGVPNTCTACHPGKSVRWAAEYVAKWYGKKETDTLHWARVLHAARTGAPAARDLLVRCAGDRDVPVMVRATALSLLHRYPGPNAAEAVRRGLIDGEPLMRLGALQSLSVFSPEEQFSQARHLLRDDLLAIRVEAAGALLDVPRTSIPSDGQQLLDQAIREYRSVQEFNADHPSAHMNLGNLALRVRDFTTAETEYRKSIQLEPAFMLSYVNLADLYRLKGEDGRGEQVLNEALKMNPDFADAHYALGLLMVRRQRSAEGLRHLDRAAILRPEDPTYAYTYAVGLNSMGDAPRAIAVLEGALKNHPYSRDLLVALVTIQRDRGQQGEALRHAETLVRFWPGEPSYARLYQELLMSGSRGGGGRR
jgi:Flp pilus assembly protein TadD